MDENTVKEAMVPSINVLNTSDLVKTEDVDFLKNHATKFEKRFRTRSLFRSKTEMEAGVLNDDEHPTPDSKYWQAIGEQNVHLTELISLDFEAKKFAADTELIAAEIEELEEDLITALGVERKKIEIKIRRKRVEYEQNKFNMMQMNKTAQERMREIKTWEPIIEALESQLKYGDESFELHHPERYFLRYKRRADHLELVDPEARENVVSHANSFKKHLEKETKQIASTGYAALKNEPAAANIPPELPYSCQVDYKDKADMDKDDPIAKSYFDRKVRTIMVCSPHRAKGDRNATNFNAMQPPAGFNCFLEEPYGMTVPDARNFAVKKAIENGVTYIFFVDDDTLIPKNALVKLIKHNAEAVGGLYYRKYFPLETVGMHETADKEPCSIDDYKIGDIIHDTLVLPSGCTLLKVETLKKMDFPWYKTITVNGRPTLTEDTYLCQKLKNVGVDIITDTSIQCIHVDFSKGRFYGHPDIVDAEKNEVKEPFRDIYAV